MPRMPLGTPEGNGERLRALRRRLQLSLPAEDVAALKACAAEFRARGVGGARLYVEEAWKLLASCKEAEELLAELICAQGDPVLQRALRAVLLNGGEADGARDPQFRPPQRGSRVAAAVPSVRAIADFQLLVLPEPQLMQILGCSPSASALCSFGACSHAAKAIADSDHLWAHVWRLSVGACPAPPTDLRANFLRWLASLCVECGERTDFEHAILGCRLCEQCERSCSRYVLVRANVAIREYQLPQLALRSLPHLDGATGRVYLRSAVESLASRHHSREGLQQLRAKNEVGVTASGRQRKRAAPRGKASGMSTARELTNRRSSSKFADEDPCCFEATALRRANESAQGSFLWDSE